MFDGRSLIHRGWTGRAHAYGDCGVLAGAMKMTGFLAAALVAATPATTRAAPAFAADADAPTVTPLSAGPSLASPEPSRPPPAVPGAPQEKGRWYGWELILGDALFLLLANDRGHETALGAAALPIGLAGIVAVPPALHLIHGNPRRTGWGLLVRGVTVGLYTATVLSARESSNTCPGDAPCTGITDGDIVLLGMTFIALGGAITYVFIDDFFFSRVPVAALARPRTTVAPTAYLRPGGGGLGLVGTF
jgi:hypothetical protein